MRAVDGTVVRRSVPIAVVAAVVIGVPTDLIDTRLFGRPIPPRPTDYLVVAATAILIGLVLAMKPPAGPDIEREERRTIWSGFLSLLAVGCPVCNQAVVALVGASGALSIWAPVQPLLGILAVGVLVWTLRSRVLASQARACPI